MTSNGVPARDQVLAELAALGPGSGDALALLTQVRQAAVFADQVMGELARLAGVVDRTGSFAAAEQEMLEAATVGLPGSRSAAEALARSGAPEAGVSPGESPEASGSPAETASGHPVGDAAPPQQGDDWAPPGLDPRELRRLGEDLTYRADPDGVEERQRKRFERRYLSFGLTLDNVGTISGAGSDSLSVEIIRTAAEAFSPPGGTEDHRTAAQRRMDGLTAACQAALDSGRAGSRHGAMPHLTVLFGTTARPNRRASPRTGPPWLRQRRRGAGLRPEQPRRRAHRPPHPPLETRRQNPATRPGPALLRAPPLLHPPTRLDPERPPRRAPALHPPPRPPHPRQPTPLPDRGPESLTGRRPGRPAPPYTQLISPSPLLKRAQGHRPPGPRPRCWPARPGRSGSRSRARLTGGQGLVRTPNGLGARNSTRRTFWPPGRVRSWVRSGRD